MSFIEFIWSLNEVQVKKLILEEKSINLKSDSVQSYFSVK